MEENNFCDLNVSFSSSDLSNYDLDLSNSSNGGEQIQTAEEILDMLHVSLSESTEFADIIVENSNPASSNTCPRPEYLNNHVGRFLNHSLHFNSSYKSMESMAKVLNSTPNTSVKVPATIFLIKKFISPAIKYDFHIKCSCCKNYIKSDKNEVECTLCEEKNKTARSDYFITFSLAQQLTQSIESNLDAILTYNELVINSGNITDLHNGIVFQKAQKKYPSSIILPLIINTDGVKVFNCSSDSLWMIQICQAFLPPAVRFIQTNVLIVAAHFGQCKPKMDDFFYPILKDLSEINKNGGINVSKRGMQYNFLPLIISSCCDLPAKADLQGMIGHSGYFGCGYCMHPGILIKGEKKSTVRYVKGSNDYEIRSHDSVIKVYEKLKSKPINGIKKISCMIAANMFDLIHGFAIDQMHCLHLGVMKLLLSLWLDSKYKSNAHYMKKNQQILLSTRILNLKPVSEIIRRPRSIFKRGDFKANEFRALLLYFLPQAMDGLLGNKYVKHFCLLSSAAYTLSKEIVTVDDIQTARTQLNKFADLFESYYGKSKVTMNVHLLRHLPLAVENLGPLWTQSAYSFEANNGIVIKSNNSKRDIIHQLAWKYTMKKTLNPEEKKIENIELNGKKTVRINAFEKVIFAQNGFEINADCLTIYKSVILRGTKFSSTYSKEISTIDYFIQLQDGSFSSIQFFTIFDSTLYAFINMYEIIDRKDHFINVQSSEIKKIIKMSDIHSKAIYLKVGRKEFVTVFSNKYEKM